MNFDFYLDFNDYLTHQLYIASNSNSLQSKTKKNKILIPFYFIFLSIVLYYNNSLWFSFAFVGVAILWYFLFPHWEKRVHLKHFKNYIYEHFTNRINQNITIDISALQTILKEKGIECIIQNSEILKIVELKAIAMIFLKNGTAIILPKHFLQSKWSEIKSHLKRWSLDLNIDYLEQLDWQW